MHKPIQPFFLAAIAGLVAYSASAATPPLTGADLGYPSNPGSITQAGDQITIVGGGADIWGTADAGYYAYFEVTGDFDYVVKVESLVGNSGDGGWSKAELMARQVLDTTFGPEQGDPHISNMTTRPSSDTANGAPAGVNYRGPQWRAMRDNNSSWTTPNPAFPPNIPDNWMRMERVGSVFYMYTSDDGQHWSMYNPYSPQGWDTAGSWPGGADSTAQSYFTEAWPPTILLGLAVTAHNDAATTEAVFSNFKAWTPVPIQITTQPPATLAISANTMLELSVETTGDPVHFQWRKDGSPVPTNGLAATYTVPLAKVSDSGTYTVRVYGAGQEVISTPTVVSVTQDTTPPTIASANPDSTFTALIVTFSEPVSDTALAAANYRLDQGVTVSSVARLDPFAVKLTTSRMQEATEYVLTVNNVQDTASPPNTIAANSTEDFQSWIFTVGYCLHKFWDNVTANTLTGLTNDVRFPDSPTFVTMEPMWEYGPDGVNESGSNYGNQITGWFTPSRTGNYVFFTNSDDPSNLYLSTDEDPANKKLIAQETGWSNARNWVTVGSGDVTSKRSDQFINTEWPDFSTITLTANRRYYLESIHTEGGGGDSVGATFIMEFDADPVNGDPPALTGSLIGAYLDPNGASIDITQQPQSVSTAANTTATFSVVATGTSVYGTTLTYQWQKAAPGSATFTDIAGATADSYTTPFLAAANNGEKYRVVISRLPITETSAEALLTITSDTVPPTIVSVQGNPTQLELTLNFSEPLDNASAIALANYAFDQGLTISQAILRNETEVVLTTSQQTEGTQYTLTVNNVKDLAGNTIAPNTKVPFTPATLATGAVAYWNFDGDFKDWMKRHDGSERGTSPIAFVDGKAGFGKAIQLLGPSANGGADQYVEITGGEPDDMAFAGGSMSLSAWFTVEAWDVSWQALAAKGESANWRIHRRSAENVMGFTGGSAGDTPSGTTDVYDLQWHHLVAIKDAAQNTSYLWIDGVLDATLPSVGALSSNGQRMMIGENPDARGRYWHGSVDDVAVWNRPLVASEIAKLYAGGAGKPLGTFLPEVIIAPEFTSIRRNTDGTIRVEWTGGGTLQAAPAVTGPWQDVTGATSPYTLTPDQAMLFGRIRQ